MSLSLTGPHSHVYEIPGSEIKFHPHSFGDPDGRLFWWNEQLYRGIIPEKTAFFRQLFQDGVIQELVDRGLLIESQPTDLRLDRFGMVVRHRCVPFASYPHEWCAAMFKDAALTYIDLATELVRKGLILKDTHPWNILFDACKPVYVDLTSIRSLTAGSQHPPYDKFCRYYLYPLILMSQGKDRLVRCLMPEYEGVSESDVLALTEAGLFSELVGSKLGRVKTLLRGRMPQRMRRLASMSLGSINALFCKQRPVASSALGFLQDLRGQLENISLDSRISANDLDSSYGGSCRDGAAAKQQALHRILSELKPNSVLDVAAGAGCYSILAGRLGSQVVSLDANPVHTGRLYHEARDSRLSILPLVIDFTDPTPSRGLSSHSSIAATERLRCELVLALSLLPDIVHKRKLNFEQIVEGLALFSRRWLVLEFAQLDRRGVSPLGSGKFLGYTLENLTNALVKRFRTVDLLHLDAEAAVWLVCEK